MVVLIWEASGRYTMAKVNAMGRGVEEGSEGMQYNFRT